MVIAKEVQGKDFRRVLDYVHSKEGKDELARQARG
jgi:hypothetical protein